MLPLTSMFLVALTTQAAAPVSATKLAISNPAPVVEIDTGKLKGEPVRLSWSPDAQQIYVQLVEEQRSLRSVTHALIALAQKSIKKIDGEPEWSGQYWAWKSAQAAPGASSFKIDVESRQELKRSTAVPRGGGLARGDPGASGGGAGAVGGTPIEDAISAGNQSQNVTTYTLKLKGDILGEWVNKPVMPGLTFGWAPKSLGVIAFGSRTERLVVMDETGAKQEVAGARDVLLPGWSDSGSKLAYLQPNGRTKFNLMVADVATAR